MSEKKEPSVASETERRDFSPPKVIRFREEELRRALGPAQACVSHIIKSPLGPLRGRF